jgi:uncharacterized Tic20 family protein
MVVTTEFAAAAGTIYRDVRKGTRTRLMTSNPSHPTPEWPVSGPASSEPLEGLPLAEDGFPAPDGRWHTGPLGPVHTGPLSRVQTGPQSPWQTGPHSTQPSGGRWPTTRAPWPGPADEQPSAGVLERGTGEQFPVAARGPAGRPGPAEPGDERLATMSYLSVPFLGPLVPLFVYLIKKRSSAYVRSQSVQALNLSITTLLYTLCALILAAMLALDSVTVALVFVVPLAVVLWLTTLIYVILAASRASHGDYVRIPAWLCATILR